MLAEQDGILRQADVPSSHEPFSNVSAAEKTKSKRSIHEIGPALEFPRGDGRGRPQARKTRDCRNNLETFAGECSFL